MDNIICLDAYGDFYWKDKLTAYNGQTITYDAIGNPLNDGTWAYTWKAGRQLAGMSKSRTTISYEYNHNGLRTGKTVNGVRTDYMLHGKLITQLKKGSDTLHIYYDAMSRPSVVAFNGAKYTYLHNLQGDVVGLLDSAGNLVVEYKYDAWGKPISKSGPLASTLGTVNPFRYRGYVYDEETELYYLRSRYYSSVWGRFINADSVINDMYRIITVNLFAYCRNSPLMYVDFDGHTAAGIPGTLPNLKSMTGVNPWVDLVYLALTISTALIANLIDSVTSKTAKKNKSMFYLAYAKGDGPVTPLPVTFTFREAEYLLGMGTLTSNYVMHAYNELYGLHLNEPGKLHVGLFTLSRTNAENLAYAVSDYVREDTYNSAELPHFHISEFAPAANIHIWYGTY